MRRRERGGIFSIVIAFLAFLLLRQVLGFLAILLALAALAFGIALIVSALKSGESQPSGTPVNTKVTGQGPIQTTSNIKVNYTSASAQTAGAAAAAQEPSRKMTAEEVAAVGEASKQLAALKTQSALIKDTEVRAMVIEICNQLSKIIADLKMDPDDIHTARKVLSYYLPSMQEIVTKYLNLESSGTDMTEMQETIRTNLPQIKEALGKQYEELFENDKLNLKVDMKAMNETFRREGYGADAPFAAQTSDAAESAPAAEESSELKPLEMPQ